MFNIGATEEQDIWLWWGIIFKSRVLDLGLMDGIGDCEPLETECKTVFFVCAYAQTMSIILGRRVYSFYQISIAICDSRKVKNHIKALMRIAAFSHRDLSLEKG